MGEVTGVTVKDRAVPDAAAYSALAATCGVTVQVPAADSVTIVPEAEHTLGVLDVTDVVPVLEVLTTAV